MLKKLGSKEKSSYTINDYFLKTNSVPKPDYSVPKKIELFEKTVNGESEAFQTAYVELWLLWWASFLSFH